MLVKMMSWKRYIIVGITLLVFLFFVFIPIYNRPDVPVLDQAEPFILKDIQGQTYNSDNKKVKLLAFFYTNCPDICPLTMVDFKLLQDQLKKEGLFGKEVELIAITLDPEVDTFEVIDDYAQRFEADPAGWKFLRGSMTDTVKIADSYHMKFKKVSGGYLAHNTTMFIIDENNQIRGLYDMANAKKNIEKDEILKVIRFLVKE